MEIAITVESLRARIKKARNGNLLASGKVTLLAASKGQSEVIIKEAIEAGITDFGENRVQEALDKWVALREAYPHVRLHLIGPLQTNKVKQALKLFDVIETIDRVKLAEAIALEIKKPGSREAGNKNAFPASRLPAFSSSFFIQINTGKEPQKAGVIPEEADAFIDYCIKALRLPIAGLMCIPPVGQPPAPHFALLRKIALDHGLHELSMGMSDDFEIALRMGSTCVRLGRAIFGERK